MLHHEIKGVGPTVVLLHSGGMSGRQWRRLAERLAPSFQVVTPDFLGSGENPPWPADVPFDFRLDVAAVNEVIDAVASSAPVHLVGHSYGGLIALTVGRERPELVQSIAVYDPVVFGVLYGAGDREGLADLERASENPVFLDEARGGGEEWLEAFVDYWSGPGAWKALPPPMRASFEKVGRKVYGEVTSLMVDRTPASAYAALGSRALLLTGERSPVSVHRITTLLSEALTSSAVEIVEGAGHMGPITHADKVNASIERHIKASAGGVK
jgi:pimeloyl-ACP methyl ester carboxylesterase